VTELWGKSDGPTVYLWDTLTEEEKKACNEQLEKTKDWVVWCKSSTEIDDTTSAMRLGKVVFCSKKATKETEGKKRGNKDKKELQQKGSRTNNQTCNLPWLSCLSVTPEFDLADTAPWF
jgi:hypothetical protein